MQFDQPEPELESTVPTQPAGLWLVSGIISFTITVVAQSRGTATYLVEQMDVADLVYAADELGEVEVVDVHEY